MATKLIENVDEKTWLRFTSWCRAEGVLVGEQMTEILNKFMHKQKGDAYARYIEEEQPNYDQS